MSHTAFFPLFGAMWQGVCRASITTLRELCAPPPSFYGYIVYTGIQNNSTHNFSALCAIAFLFCNGCVCVYALVFATLMTATILILFSKVRTFLLVLKT